MKVQALALILYVFTLLQCTLLPAQDSKDDTLAPSLRFLEIDDTFKIKHVGSLELSPFNHIKKVSTPTLFACGEKDWNDPVQNSEQLYQSLRRRGITTRLVVYPGEHHDGWTYTHQKDFLERCMAWYDRYVKSESAMQKVK